MAAISISSAFWGVSSSSWMLKKHHKWAAPTNSVTIQALWGVQKPEKIELEAITSENQFDTALNTAQESNRSIIIEWMAAWCRKCIYLKPRLEKLAAEFHPDIKFYSIDVNTVPKALVTRAGVTKMPTIQLWRNGEKKDEVIGGHQAWLVLDEIRNMIKKQQ